MDGNIGQHRQIAEAAESVIREWVNTAYEITLATLGKDDEAGQRAIKQMRHLHLAQPSIPASRIAAKLGPSAHLRHT